MRSSPSATIVRGAADMGAITWSPAALTPGAPPVADAQRLPAFEPKRTGGPTISAFAVDRTSGIPADLLAAESAAARASGYAAGYATGIAEARALAAERAAQAAARDEAAAAARDAAVTQAFEAVFDAATELKHRRVSAAADIEEQIVQAAWSIASAIVGQVLADADTRSKAGIARALSLAPADDDVTVSVSPADFVALGGSADDTTTPLRRTRGLRTVTIVADDSLRDGDAVAQAGLTTIDARLDAAIERVKQVLLP